MELLCAVDLIAGRAVRLVQGDFARATDFGDPRALARRYLDAGARWLHAVDLDAARTGRPANRGLVRTLAADAHDAGARIEVGGGLRTESDVDDVLGAGADRAVLGTAAVADPAFARRCAVRHPGRVAVGVDYRAGAHGLEPAVEGWATRADADVPGLVGEWAEGPVAAFVVTAIERDGTLGGPDTAGLGAVLDLTTVPVVASGGVGAVEDLRRLAALRSPAHGRALAGVVVGRALVDGTLRVEEAVAACAASG